MFVCVRGTLRLPLRANDIFSSLDLWSLLSDSVLQHSSLLSYLFLINRGGHNLLVLDKRVPDGDERRGLAVFLILAIFVIGELVALCCETSYPRVLHVAHWGGRFTIFVLNLLLNKAISVVIVSLVSRRVDHRLL